MDSRVDVSWRSACRDRGIWAATAVALVLASVFCAGRLAVNEWDLSVFVGAGDRFADPNAVGDGVTVYSNTTGYDGQFTYRLALEPLTRTPTDFGVTLDRPAYRQQRILLPLAAWGLHTATPLTAPMAILLVNLLSVAAVAFVAGFWFRRFGRSPFWGVLVAASPGIVIALARDLNEPLAWALTLAALACWTNKQVATAALFFCLAALTRETTLLVPAGLALIQCWLLLARHRRDRETATRIAALAAPLAVYVAWRGYLRFVWRDQPAIPDVGESLSAPFVGVFGSFTGEVARSYPGMADDRLLALWQFERFLLLAVLAAGLLCVVLSRAHAAVRAACALALALAFCLSSWAWDAQFFRATLEAWVLSLLLLVTWQPQSKATTLLRKAGLGVAVATSAFVAELYVLGV